MMARTKVRRSAIAVVDLPHDVVINIISHVAVSSPHLMANLCSLRATYKAMYKTPKEGAVGRRVTLEREEAMKWLDNERYLAVVNHLASAGNSEVCSIVSLPLVFAHQDMQSGPVCLERAADAGHKAATYLLGLLLYTADKMHNVGKHYISQVEGEPADGRCETARRTNRECKRCQRFAVDAVQEVAWKMAGPLGQVWALSKDGHRCTSTGCGMTEEWDNYAIFCCDEYRIMHEYAM